MEGECIPLSPGQATLHHIRTAHRSGPAAPGSQARLGLALRYMAAHVQQGLDPRDSGEGWGCRWASLPGTAGRPCGTERTEVVLQRKDAVCSILLCCSGPLGCLQ